VRSSLKVSTVELRRIICLAILLSVFVGCGGRDISPNRANPVYKVAVLPFYNATNDIDGPVMVRGLFAARLDRWHYSSLALEDVDSILRNDFGITLGAQLELVSAAELGAALGVDALFYGYLLDFNQITTGVYNEKKVRAGFKLVDAKTGSVVWSGGLGVKSLLTGGDIGVGILVLKKLKGTDDDFFTTIKGLKGIPGLNRWHIMQVAELDSPVGAAVISLGEQLVTKALGAHLKSETKVMLKRVMRNLPAGPGR
jgi:hypothetical protein